MSHVVCHYCGSEIQLPFECRGEYPLHFKATCPKCKRTDVYHACEVVEHDPERCEEARRRAEEMFKPIRAWIQVAILSSLYETIRDTTITLRRMLERAEKA